MSGHPVPAPSSGLGRRAAAGAVAVLVFVAAGILLWTAFTPADRAQPIETRAAAPWAELPEGWTELPAPPERVAGATLVRAGDTLLAWGGYESETERAVAGGYAFDSASMEWRDIPPAPIARDGAHAVWTGTEAVFVGAGRTGIGWTAPPSTRGRRRGVRSRRHRSSRVTPR